MAFSSNQPLQSNQLPLSIDYPSPSDPNFLDTLSLDRKRISDSMNTKVGGLYSQEEIANFKRYNMDDPQTFNNSYRKSFNITQLNGGNIAGGATVSFPHNITGLLKAGWIYAECTSTDPLYFSVVYPNVYLTSTNVVFTNPLGTPIVYCYVHAEYLKN